MGTGRSVNDWQRHLAVVLGCLFSCFLIWWHDQLYPRQPAPREVKHSSAQFDDAINSMMLSERMPWKVSNSKAGENEKVLDDAETSTEAPLPKVKKWPSLEPCEARYRDPSSRPGRPCLPQVDNQPYRSDTYHKKLLGERAYLAAIGVVDESDCDSWRLFGDMTWCTRALTSREGTEQPDGEVIGLSYGIEERDLWSELVSNDYGVPTQLFDCYQNPKSSPPLSGKVVNGSSCNGVSGHCYSTPYQAFRICLGGATDERTIRNDRVFESLKMHLQSRHRLSVHLKIDTEGAEWEELEWLVSSPTDMDKIRTFDMEVHIGWLSASASDERKRLSPKERIARDIGTLEALGKYFRCTGSSMEELAEEWSRSQEGGRCNPKSCPEPDAHTATGFSVIQFAISFVHPKLLKTGPKPLLAKPELPVGAVDETQITWPCTRKGKNQGSRPGMPCLPNARPLPYKTQQKQRTDLGERAIKAVSGALLDQGCIFQLVDDVTWCLEAFPNETSSSGRFIGLSYGLSARDLWSERISQAKVRTRLYDCKAKRPFPLASNGTRHCSAIGPSTAPCYVTPYESYPVCITAGTKDGLKGPFENIQEHLSGRERLAVHMKIDVGAASVDVLDLILKSGEINKIRTLDVTLQLGASGGQSSPLLERIERDIEILQNFREVMQVSGSTLEFMAEQWAETVGRRCAEKCEEPEAHAPGGFPLVLPFTISYVHAELLR